MPMEETSHVLAACAALAVKSGASLAPVAGQLQKARHRLDEPMRLAVAGQIKRGKSTLVNALLGEEVAATGQLELTFTISELCYGARRAVYVHRKDGTVRGPLPPSALERLTVRDHAMLDVLRTIRTVEYVMPNELLRAFRLIDTPGLGSIHVTDAENTMDYLGISGFGSEEERAAARNTMAAMGRTGADIHAESMAMVSAADAVLYLFTRGMHERDLAAVAEFLGSGPAAVTPLRAFAVLSRCDELWPPGRELPGRPKPAGYDPMAAAAKIADRYMSDPEIGRLFYTMIPVAGKVGIGARLLRAEHFGWLDELVEDTAAAADPEAALARALHDVQRFANAPQLPGIRLPVQMRAGLMSVLGGWGSFLACRYRREKSTEDETRDRLADASGVTRLRDLIVSHFGNRATGIKLDHGLREVTNAIGRCRREFQLVERQAPAAMDIVAAQIERIRNDDRSAAEFSALAAYYNGELAFSDDDVAELLTATGEHGTSAAARLGLNETATASQLQAAAARLAAKWARRDQDPALTPAGRDAARTMRRCYDQILTDLRAPSPEPRR